MNGCFKNSGNIPVSVLVVTKNEEKNIGRCLDALLDFSEVIVVDSYSTDQTVNIAEKYNAKVVLFRWNNAYPKKRQWCIDTQNISYDWILWIDADEVVTTAFVDEIREMSKNSHQYSGFFIRSQYMWKGRALRHGMTNNKLALYNKSMIEFPVVNDLDFGSMGEIEGHYQPVQKNSQNNLDIGQINSRIIHHAYDDGKGWEDRHNRYAKWESQMIFNNAYPVDPAPIRQLIKRVTRGSFFRPYLMFFYSYIYKRGFLDGRAGYEFALSRKLYCDMVLGELRKLRDARKRGL